MTARKPIKKPRAAKGKESVTPPIVQQALQVTWLLKSSLKNMI